MGVEKLVQLVELDVSINRINSVRELKNLSKLTSLKLYSNKMQQKYDLGMLPELLSKQTRITLISQMYVIRFRKTF